MKFEIATNILYLNNNTNKLHLNKYNNKSSTIIGQQSKNVIVIKTT